MNLDAWVDKRIDVTSTRLLLYHAMESVVQVSLTWIELVVVVMYTGPLVVLHNGILSGFGFLGEFAEDSDFG